MAKRSEWLWHLAPDDIEEIDRAISHFKHSGAPMAAITPDNFHVQRWNYIYSADYGSPEVKVSDPKQEGRDEVDVVSSTLFDGGHTVFLEIPDLRPAMQMKIGYTLKTATGEALRQTVHPTIHRVAADRVEENRLHRRARPGHLTDDQVAELRPGIVVRFEQGEQKDVRVDRLFAWIVPAGFAPSAFITSPAESRSFRFTASAFLHVDLKGDYRMGLTGHGDATLSVNGKRVINANGEFGDSAPTSVSLRKGYNEIELTYASPPIGDANCRVWWSSADFAPEPIPPTALFHDGDGKELKTFTRLRAGQRLHDDLRCADCHNFLRPDQKAIDKETPSPHLETPNWSDIGRRLSPDWVYRWLLDPSSLRNAPRMPRSLNAAQAADRQIAADIAVYLDSLRAVEPASDVAPQVESDAPPLDGRILYEDLGCIACHRLTAPAESDENRRQSLHFVAAKFLPGQLANFLLKPQSHYPKTRMPDFRLTVDEAAALA